jgi:glyoxylase-like metal-dependent hydrolase (beta-lactamase superfamily II)
MAGGPTGRFLAVRRTAGLPCSRRATGKALTVRNTDCSRRLAQGKGRKLDEPYQASPDVHVLPTHVPIPGLGNFLVNAYVLLAEEPVLIDSGLGVDGPEFEAALESIISPGDLRWIWLTHDDADHTGSIRRVMEIAPRARLATPAFAAMRMSTWWPVPLDRVHAITWGDRLDVGDRTLRAIAPPVFDNPTSTGIYDELSGTLFSVDAFGAILPEVTQNVTDVPAEALTQGMVAWGTSDSPWAHLVETGKFEAALARVRQLDPKMILSSHLPAASGPVERLLDVLRTLPAAEPFVPPDNAAFQQMLALMGPSEPAEA